MYRPLWSEGALLSPQQFQQQAHWEAYNNECIAHLSLVHPWGVEAAEFDSELLALQRLQALKIRVRLPDGTLVDTGCADLLPATRELAHEELSDKEQVIVLLALPILQSNTSNVQTTAEIVERPLRYWQEWVSVQDAFGPEEESMAVARHSLSLRFDFEQNDEYIVCPLARLVRDGRSGWKVDSGFIPPLLSFAAHNELVLSLDRLLTQLQAKRRRLMGMRRESNQRMADFAVADVSLFWLLNALNTHVTVLSELLTRPARHPEQVYFELTKLAGALLTFSLDHDVEDIPPYDHHQPETVFPPLFALISDLLEASLPSRMVAIDLVKINGHQWKAPLNDIRLREEADFYLSVRSSLPAHQLLEQFPKLCKVGAPDDVNNIVNVALNGVPLIALSQVPAVIPLRMENQYFALDMKHPAAISMLESGVCMFYVPDLLGNIQLELFAVLRA
ncbi:type VI secretion system baseplate subunit TssK [Xenorhabdus szentirmaii]|uniref:type VI secretion system baseplate subunit TssK n=1 Tax=Xenorhabdus szentirmaii TaxID=290112 RepID=UPI002B4063BC|nr:type VI secretion system baseplate subunit TssK [Xenorhabdus sp. M]